MTQCGQRTGFLTFTMCNEPAIATCLKCGKLICAMHIHTSPAGPQCPDCAAIGLDEYEASRRGLDSSYYRGHSSYDAYSASDYDSFNAGGGEMGGGGAGGDWDNSDDVDSVGDSDSGDGGAAFQDS